MTVFTDLIQGTDEWKRIRKGKPSASRFSDIVTAKKGELSKSASGYIRELIGECFAPDWEEFAGNRYTDRGTELEPEARDAFRAHTGLTVVEVGGVLGADGISWCSPDGLITSPDDEYVAGLEIKCPSPKVHVGYVLDGVLPDAYVQQVHGGMAIAGLNHWHFWSYFPGMMPFHLIVHRDDYTERLSNALAGFVAQYRTALAEATPRLRVPSIYKEDAQ